MSKYWKDGKWIETDAQSVNLIPHDEETGDIDFNVKQYFQASPEEPTNPDIEVWLDTDEEALPNELTKNVSIEEIQGRTLVNLLGRSGNAIYKNWNYGIWGDLSYEHDTFKVDKTGTTHNKCNLHTSGYDIGITFGKYYIAIAEIKGDNVYITGATANQIIKYTNYGSGYNIYCVAFNPVDNKYIEVCSDSDIAYFKNIRLYEITSDEYYDINLLTAEEINMKYPYVDDVKCVVNPYFEYKENYIQDFYLGASTISSKDYYYEDFSNEQWVHSNPIYLKAGEYILSQADFSNINCINKVTIPTFNPYNLFYLNDLIIDSSGCLTLTQDTLLSICFNVKQPYTNKDLLNIIRNLHLTLVEGNIPKSYNECSNSRIMFETKLYDGETITRRNDGTYIKNSLWGEINLNGNDIKVANIGKYQGITCVEIEADSIGRVKHSDSILYDDYIIKYNGDIFPSLNNSNANSYKTDESFHWGGVGHNYRRLCLSLPKELTGWGDGYTPTQEEIKAFFLGWRMGGTIDLGGGIHGGDWSNPYDPNIHYSKCWAKLWVGVGEKGGNSYQISPVVRGSHVDECPTTMNDQGYTPYRLVYKKENPTIEEVKTYGSLSIKNKNNITASSGLVLNEKFRMFFTPYHTRGDKDTNNSKYYRIQKFLKAKDRNNNIINFKSDIYDSEGMIKCGLPTLTPIDNTNLQPYLYCDYMIYNPDTVKSFNYKINTSDDFTDYLNSLVKENNYLSQELSNTKQELNQIKHELSQRSNPNLFFNGDFQIWQRGTSFSGGRNKYTADRWKIDSDGEIKAEKQSYGIKITNTGLGTWHNLDQIIEIPNSLKGKKVTLSAKFHSSCNLQQIYFGYGIKNSDTNKSIYADFNLNNITYYEKTVTIPENCSIFWVGFQLIEELGATIELEWVKLELGEYATPFVPRTYGEELLVCQRYYYRPKNQDGWRTAHSLLGAGICYVDSNIKNMRTLPSPIFNNGNTQVFTNNSWVDITFSSINENQVMYSYTDSSILHGNSYLIHNVPSFDAEIY